MRATRVGGGLENRHLVKSGADVSENGLCNRRDLLSCDSKAFEHFTMECCIEQLFRLPTTRILAWNICWLAPSTGTNRDHFPASRFRVLISDGGGWITFCLRTIRPTFSMRSLWRAS